LARINPLWLSEAGEHSLPLRSDVRPEPV